MLEHFASGALIEVLPDYKCIYADGALPATWIVFADRRAAAHQVARRFHRRRAGASLAGLHSDVRCMSVGRASA